LFIVRTNGKFERGLRKKSALDKYLLNRCETFRKYNYCSEPLQGFQKNAGIIPKDCGIFRNMQLLIRTIAGLSIKYGFG